MSGLRHKTKQKLKQAAFIISKIQAVFSDSVGASPSEARRDEEFPSGCTIMQELALPIGVITSQQLCSLT